MSSQPTISIIIPTHNRRRLLQETIASVVAQTFEDWELLVIDDASEDETWPWLRGLQEARIQAFRFDGQVERTRARNFGLEKAAGDFVLFLDDDDLLPRSALQAHLRALELYPSALGSVGGFMMFGENGARQTTRYVRRRRLHDLWPDLMFGHIPVFGQCMFRTQTVKMVKGWDTAYNICEDHELWLRLSPLGRIVLLPDLVLEYRVHSGQWRTRKLWQLMTKIRKRAIKRLEGKRREHAESIMQAREHFRAGENHFAKGETARALAAYLKTVRLMPGALRSPVTRMMIVPPILKCLIGGRPVIARLPGKKTLEFSRPRIVDEGGEEYQPLDGESGLRQTFPEAAAWKVD